MTRVLFFGDLAGTGFGTVTMDLGRALLDLGHDVRFVSQNELGELPEPFASRAYIVNDYLTGYAADPEFRAWKPIRGEGWADGWAPEAVILLGDFYGVRNLVYVDEATEAAFRDVPTFHYAPIEGVDLPPSWRRLWEFVTPVAMSEFGAREIGRLTRRPVDVVYHGVDASAFWPVSAARPIRLGTAVLRSREEARAYFRVPGDARVLLRTDRNMPRKRYPSLLRAMTPVLEARPDVWLVMHCRSHDEGGDLRDVHSKLPREVAKRVVNTGYHDLMGGLDRASLNALYNTADVYVSTSAEGFGLTIAEAIACGVPAVGMDYSSVPEVIGPAGRVVPITGLIDNEYAHFWAAIDERAMARAVGELLDDPALRQTLGAKGPHHVRSAFSWAAAAERFARIIGARLEG